MHLLKAYFWLYIFVRLFVFISESYKNTLKTVYINIMYIKIRHGGWYIFSDKGKSLRNPFRVKGQSCHKAIRYRRPFVTSAPLSWMQDHAEPMRMRTNVVYFRVMRRLYRREWNWLCLNQQTMTTDKGSRRVTAYSNSVFLYIINFIRMVGY